MEADVYPKNHPELSIVSKRYTKPLLTPPVPSPFTLLLQRAAPALLPKPQASVLQWSSS
jgi:hypothetical protein